MMLRNYILVFLFIFFTTNSLWAIDTIRVRADFERINKEIQEESFRPAYAHLISHELDLRELLRFDLSGMQQELRVFIESKRALGLGLYFDDFQLPKSGKLWLESVQGNVLAGPYDFQDNANGGSFALPLIGSSKMILRYQQSNLDDAPKLKLGEIAHAFRDVPFSQENASRDFGDSESCQVNVNCSEGNNWKSQSRAVVRISVKVGSDLFWCSGTIMNNTNQDCTPYILTADHCGEGASSADLEDWVFYFQYESTGCSNPSSEGSLANKSMTGCSLKSNSGNAGDSDSDFWLVELDAAIPQFYNPYFAGWDRSGNASQNGVGIHHPSGDLKKISTYNSLISSGSWGGTVNGTHWLMNWSATSNGHGVTESGSSGSALFNNGGQVIGILTGGSSACSSSPGQGPNENDYYGKFAYAWESEGSTDNKRLKPWLDPTNSGLSRIGGIAWPCLEDPLTGIDSPAIEDINTYPNPSKGIVRWTIPSIVKTEVYGADGRLLNFRIEDNSIDLSQHAYGIYLIRLTDKAGKIYQSKIMKQ